MSTNYGSGITITPNGRKTYLPDGMPQPESSSSRAAEGHSRHIRLSTTSGITIPMGRLSNHSETTLYPASRPESISSHYPPVPRSDYATSRLELRPSSMWPPRLDAPRHISNESLSSKYTVRGELEDDHESKADTRVGSLSTAGEQKGCQYEGKDIEMQRMEPPGEEGKLEGKKDPNLIEWDGPNDPNNPMNFPRWRKWVITTMMGVMTFCITFASSVFSTATEATAEVFGVSSEVMTLGTSLFVLGFAVGPIVWGPFSVSQNCTPRFHGQC
jgi:hypothetical protein